MIEAERQVAVQFEDLAKQKHAARLGMWLFLGSELLLFAGLFALYTAYRTMYAADFARGVHHNSLWIGTTNTVVLIVSSFTVAWSIHALRNGNRRMALGALGVTMLLGLLFLVFKGIEYGEHFREGVFPGAYYASRVAWKDDAGAPSRARARRAVLAPGRQHLDLSVAALLPDDELIMSTRSGAPYVYALVGLLCLTALTFGLHFVSLGAASVVIALAIAGAKVCIVGTVFMELRESLAVTRTVAIVAVLFVVLLCLGIAGDVAFR